MASRSGGRSGSPVSKSRSSLSTWVRQKIFPPFLGAPSPGLLPRLPDYRWTQKRGTQLHKLIIEHMLTRFIPAGFIYFASYTYFTSTYWPWMPNAGQCAGEEFAAFAGIASISSYLVLFISFYLATYKKERKPPTARKSLRRMSQAPLPDPHSLMGAEGAATPSKAANGFSTGAKTNGSSTPRSRKA